AHLRKEIMDRKDHLENVAVPIGASSFSSTPPCFVGVRGRRAGAIYIAWVDVVDYPDRAIVGVRQAIAKIAKRLLIGMQAIEEDYVEIPRAGCFQKIVVRRKGDELDSFLLMACNIEAKPGIDADLLFEGKSVESVSVSHADLQVSLGPHVLTN